jgi:hypothetical protein
MGVSIPKILRYCGDINHLKKPSRIISIFYIIPKILRYSHQLVNPYLLPFLLKKVFFGQIIYSRLFFCCGVSHLPLGILWTGDLAVICVVQNIVLSSCLDEIISAGQAPPYNN